MKTYILSGFFLRLWLTLSHRLFMQHLWGNWTWCVQHPLSNFKKGHCSQKKNGIKMSCGYAHLHIMSFINTKFQEILLSAFRGVALTNCFTSIFHFRQISKFKKSVIQRKTMKSKFPVDIHIYTLCPSYLQSFTIFCRAVSEELR